MLMICWDGLRASRGCIMRLQFSLLSFALALTGLALGQAVGGTHERLPNYHVLHAFWFRFVIDAKIFERQLKEQQGAKGNE